MQAQSQIHSVLQTLPAAIVDMQIGSSENPMSGYVAFTRVKRKEDLLICRPFYLEIFQRGHLEGPQLHLKTLRGENTDWAAIESQHMPSHMCSGCGQK